MPCCSCKLQFKQQILNDVTAVINNIFCGHYFFWEANRYPRAITSGKTVSFELLCLLSFKYFKQHAKFWKLTDVTYIVDIISNLSQGIFSPFSDQLHMGKMDYNNAQYWVYVMYNTKLSTYSLHLLFNIIQPCLHLKVIFIISFCILIFRTFLKNTLSDGGLLLNCILLILCLLT